MDLRKAPITDDTCVLNEPLVDGDILSEWEISEYVISSKNHDPLEEGLNLNKIKINNAENKYCCLQKWHRWAYPPNLPVQIQLFRLDNLAIPFCYLMVGLMQGISGPLLNTYPMSLGASEAQQTTIFALCSLPGTLKIAFGFLSDNKALFGYKRKSYMALGWFVSSMSMVMLLIIPKLEGAKQPSVTLFSLCVWFFASGFWFADVIGDSILVEKVRLEPEHSRGQLQSTCYAWRFFGTMIGTPMSTAIYKYQGAWLVILILAILPISMAPFVYHLKESKNVHIQSTRDQCNEIWQTVCSRAVWQPIGFVYLYNLLQVMNPAWRQYLKTVQNFTNEDLNALLIVSDVLIFVGVLVYKKFFLLWSWRIVYIITTLVAGFFSVLQLFLIEGSTFGLSPFFFALGDEACADFIAGLQFLPMAIIMAQLCPEGSEGASYALFTTVANAAAMSSASISTMLLGIWDVSEEAFVSGDTKGMRNLTLLTSSIAMTGILFVGLLPRDKKDLEALKMGSFTMSKLGGGLFLGVILFSIIFAILDAVVNIMFSGWIKES